MKILFVINPISGGIDKGPFIEQAKGICEKYGFHFHLFTTSGENDDKKLAETLLKVQPDKVASVGGDGTTLFTAIALMDKSIPMGIIPLGSANGMATELFVNQDPIKALNDLLMSKIVVGLDMLVINQAHYSLHLGDVGINASIVKAYSKDKNRGLATYAKYFIEELSNPSHFDVTIKANDKTYRETGLMVGICNARKYGLGVPLNLKGNPMDGKFEIVVVQSINLPSLVKAGLSKFDESFHDNQNSLVISTREAEIIFDEPRLLQLDGEVIGDFDKIHVNIKRGTVKLITHNNNEYLHKA